MARPGYINPFDDDPQQADELSAPPRSATRTARAAPAADPNSMFDRALAMGPLDQGKADAVALKRVTNRRVALSNNIRALRETLSAFDQEHNLKMASVKEGDPETAGTNAVPVGTRVPRSPEFQKIADSQAEVDFLKPDAAKTQGVMGAVKALVSNPTPSGVGSAMARYGAPTDAAVEAQKKMAAAQALVDQGTSQRDRVLGDRARIKGVMDQGTRALDEADQEIAGYRAKSLDADSLLGKEKPETRKFRLLLQQKRDRYATELARNEQAHATLDQPEQPDPQGSDWVSSRVRQVNAYRRSMGFKPIDPRTVSAEAPDWAAQAGATGAPDYGRGNIDMNSRPHVENADGSTSTVRSMSFNEDGKEILVPTVAADGSRILSNDEAIAQYHETGKHLGKFDSVEEANAYAQQLHQKEAAKLAPGKPNTSGDMAEIMRRRGPGSKTTIYNTKTNRYEPAAPLNLKAELTPEQQAEQDKNTADYWAARPDKGMVNVNLGGPSPEEVQHQQNVAYINKYREAMGLPLVEDTPGPKPTQDEITSAANAVHANGERLGKFNSTAPGGKPVAPKMELRDFIRGVQDHAEQTHTDEPHSEAEVLGELKRRGVTHIGDVPIDAMIDQLDLAARTMAVTNQWLDTGKAVEEWKQRGLREAWAIDEAAGLHTLKHDLTDAAFKVGGPGLSNIVEGITPTREDAAQMVESGLPMAAGGITAAGGYTIPLVGAAMGAAATVGRVLGSQIRGTPPPKTSDLILTGMENAIWAGVGGAAKPPPLFGAAVTDTLKLAGKDATVLDLLKENAGKVVQAARGQIPVMGPIASVKYPVTAAIANTLPQGALTGAVAASLDGIHQAVVDGKVDWARVRESYGIGAAMGLFFAALNAHDIHQQGTQALIEQAKTQFGFTGETLGELRTWAMARSARTMKRAEAAPAETPPPTSKPELPPGGEPPPEAPPAGEPAPKPPEPPKPAAAPAAPAAEPDYGNLSASDVEQLAIQRRAAREAKAQAQQAAPATTPQPPVPQSPAESQPPPAAPDPETPKPPNEGEPGTYTHAIQSGDLVAKSYQQSFNEWARRVNAAATPEERSALEDEGIERFGSDSGFPQIGWNSAREQGKVWNPHTERFERPSTGNPPPAPAPVVPQAPPREEAPAPPAGEVTPTDPIQAIKAVSKMGPEEFQKHVGTDLTGTARKLGESVAGNQEAINRLAGLRDYAAIAARDAKEDKWAEFYTFRRQFWNDAHMAATKTGVFAPPTEAPSPAADVPSPPVPPATEAPAVPTQAPASAAAPAAETKPETPPATSPQVDSEPKESHTLPIADSTSEPAPTSGEQIPLIEGGKARAPDLVKIDARLDVLEPIYDKLQSNQELNDEEQKVVDGMRTGLPEEQKKVDDEDLVYERISRLNKYRQKLQERGLGAARAKKAPVPATTPTAPGWKKIGVNKSGADVYENEKGVRKYSEGDFDFAEAVRMTPTRGGMGTSPRTSQSRENTSWETTDEIAARTGTVPPPAAPGALDNPPDQSQPVSNEPSPRSPEPSAGEDPGKQPSTEGAGNRGGMGGEQPGAGEAVGGGREPTVQGAGSDQPSESGTGAGKPGRTDGSGGPRGVRDVRGPELEPGVSPTNYRITEADKIGEGGLKQKYSDNIAALRLMKQILAENRPATTAEQRVLVRYVGWGGIKGVFDPSNKAWGKYNAELKELLTPEEYASARASVLNAHYTSPVVVQRGIYAALKRFGFTGGKIIEGGAGIGHFIGMMPDGMRAGSSYVGVERDPVTAKIAQLLYPEAKIHALSFEDVNLTRGSFDAAIGNPPFGETKVFDANFPEASKHSLHNYFILKQLELARPGSVSGFVVSHYFLDSVDSSARTAISKMAEFLGAIRLPNTAFKQNANTEVTTDLVFFRKLPDGQSESNPQWLATTDIPDKATGSPIRINEWLEKNRGMMLGDMTLAGTMYAGKLEATLEPRAGQDLGEALDGAVANLPEGVYQRANPAAVKRATTPAEMIPEGTAVGGYFVENGLLFKRTPDVDMQKTSEAVVGLNEGNIARIKGTLEVRDAMNNLIRAEQSPDSSPSALDALRRKLNKTYNSFVEKFGYLNQQSNRRAFSDDPHAARVLGLEKSFDPGISAAVAKKRGVASRAPKAEKAAIFTQRVNQPYVPVDHVDTSKEALAVVLNERGEVDLDHMAQLTGLDPKKIIEELRGIVFRTPRGGYQSKDQYLSGNVRQKLSEAEAALAETNDLQWKENVDALKQVIPKDVPVTEIAVSVGAPWVPAADVSQFAMDLTDQAPSAIVYRKADGGWMFEHRSNSTKATATWGTPRATFGDLFKDLLNGRPTLIYDTDRRGKRVLNSEATALAAAKAEAIKAAWEDWIWKDQDRRERLHRTYNDTMNNYVDPHYDGSHMLFPGKSPLIVFNPHQGNGIWRIITDRSALLDQVVGSGKTFIGVGAFMELRRMGIVNKSLFIVPNHLTRQWRDAFVQLYPNANILHASPADFEKANRQKFFAKILTGEYDAIVIGHSQAKKIGVSTELQRDLLNEMIAEVTEGIEALRKATGGRNNRAVAQAEKTRERIKAKINALGDVKGRDKVATFEELGIDGLFVDEAHEFKNLFYTTQMQRVAGLGDPAGSEKAFDLYLKVRYLQRQFGGKAPLVFATGTPISNSLVELFTMQRYLQPDVLEQMGLKTLDAWAKVFGSVDHVYEVDPTGTGYRMATRLANFRNVGELAATYRTVADVITQGDLQQQAELAGKRFPLPKVRGGKPQNVVAERTAEQAAYFGVPVPVLDAQGNPTYDTNGNPIENYPPGTILYRIDTMPADAREDNMLKLTSDARKAGLDMRLINPSAPDRPQSKVNEAVRRITKIYKETTPDKGTQLVFCDLSVPASARGKATAKAKAQAGEFYFVHTGEGLRPVEDSEKPEPVTLEKASGLSFFARKSGRAEWRVTERGSGLGIGRGSSKPAAVENANARMSDAAIAEFKAKAASLEEITAAKDKWAETNEMKDEAPEASGEESTPIEQAGEEKVSLDELLADQSPFSVYDDMKAKLIKAGVPAGEIAFIHDFDGPEKKQKLFGSVNRGDIRVLFGSTPKMGAGTNVQERIVALHHMDAPWRPSDLEQREGRAIRQGNKLYERAIAQYEKPQAYDADPNAFAIDILRYATNQTYDTRMWQLIEHKARGIEGFRKADRSVRTLDDVSGETANASEMKAAASGDPIIQRELELRNQVQKLDLLKRAWRKNRYDLEGKQRYMEGSQRRHDSAVSELKLKIEARTPQPDPFAYTLPTKVVVSKKDGLAKMIAGAIEAAKESKTSQPIGTYRGYRFSLRYEPSSRESRANVFATAKGLPPEIKVFTYEADDVVSDTGFITRLDNWLDGFDQQIPDWGKWLANQKAELAEVDSELKKPFSKEQELADLRSEHEQVRQQLINKRTHQPAAAKTPDQAPTDTKPASSSDQTPLKPEEAGFKSKEHFDEEYAKNHVADETPDEYMRRIYCQGLKGRNRYSALE